jgi:predicted nucleic acid-binding protein
VSFVLDASVALAWCFSDESTADTEHALRQAGREGCVVPPHFLVELANVLASAERRGRIVGHQIDTYVELIRSIALEIEPATDDVVLGQVLRLSRESGLAAYDAAYVELAQRRRLPLATTDRAVRTYAVSAGLAILRP